MTRSTGGERDESYVARHASDVCRAVAATVPPRTIICRAMPMPRRQAARYVCPRYCRVFRYFSWS